LSSAIKKKNKKFEKNLSVIRSQPKPARRQARMEDNLFTSP
jgi:hypothetical protein